MLRVLIRRELLDNLMKFRFAVAVLIMLLLKDAARKMEFAGEYVIKDVTERERLIHEYLTQQHAQIQLARSVTRVSPVVLVQHLLEVFAGTGFERHQQFVENVQRYVFFYFDTARQKITCAALFAVLSINPLQLIVKSENKFTLAARRGWVTQPLRFRYVCK